MEEVSITTDQLMQIIGMKEVELILCRAKIADLNAKVQQSEKSAKDGKKDE